MARRNTARKASSTSDDRVSGKLRSSEATRCSARNGSRSATSLVPLSISTSTSPAETTSIVGAGKRPCAASGDM